MPALGQALALALCLLLGGSGARFPLSFGRQALRSATSRGMASTSSAPRSMSSRPQARRWGTGTSSASSRQGRVPSPGSLPSFALI